MKLALWLYATEEERGMSQQNQKTRSLWWNVYADVDEEEEVWNRTDYR